MNSAIDKPHSTSAEIPRLRETALYSPASHLRLWSISLIGLTLDLWTKHWAFEVLDFNRAKVVVENILSFQCSYNSGALWGMGKGMAAVFIVASLIALVIVLGVFAKSLRSQKMFHLGLGMIVAGALGNLYDRLFVKELIRVNGGQIREVGGRVRDFIKIELSIGNFELWPWIFNVADMLLVCGVAILMIHISFQGKTPKKTKSAHSDPLTISEKIHA